MFKFSKKEKVKGPKIISRVVKDDVEVTLFQASKPILPAKHTTLANIRKQIKSQ